MELHNGQVPGDTVWALLVRAMGSYDEHQYVRWFITPEESSADYRDTVADHKRHGAAATVQRWKITLPRRRMQTNEVRDFVEDALLYQPGPTESTQLLDVSIQPEQPRRKGK